MEPSAKGSIVMGVVATLRKLRKAGQLSNEQLSARLSGAALELLEQKIELARWYPMPVFAELVAFEWEVIGKRDPEYARGSGALSADNQIEHGRYQQMDYAKRAKKADTSSALLLQARADHHRHRRVLQLPRDQRGDRSRAARTASRSSTPTPPLSPSRCATRPRAS